MVLLFAFFLQASKEICAFEEYLAAVEDTFMIDQLITLFSSMFIHAIPS